MSTTSHDTLPLLCELGWHRPEKLARWNDGYYFSKCSRCERDLVRTAYGSWQLPKGFRVVWQPKPPETREQIALVASDASEVPARPRERFNFPSADVAPPVPAAPPPPPLERAEPTPTVVVVEPAPVIEQPPVIAAPEPVARQDVAAASGPETPRTDSIDEPVPVAAGAADAAVPRVDEDPASDIAAEAAPSEQPRIEYPIDELLHQSNGTGHTVEQHISVSSGAGVAVEHTSPPNGRTELPIEEVLRHLSATPESDRTAEAECVTESVAAPAEAQRPEQDYQSAEELVPQSEEPAQATAGGDVPAPQAEAIVPPEPVVTDETPEEVPEAAAELPFEPALPPPAPPAPVQDLPPGWDFMAEEEEDPIGTFWEDPEPLTSAPRAAPATPAPNPEIDREGDAVGAPRVDAAAAPVEPEQSLPKQAEIAPAPPRTPDIEQAATEKTPPPAAAALPRWMEPEAEAAAHNSQWPEIPAPPPQQGGRAEGGNAAEAEDVPPWVDATDEERSDDDGSRSSRFAVTAVVSIGVLALAAALAGRPDSSPPPAPAQVAPIAAEPKAVKKTATAEPKAIRSAPKTASAKREPGFVSPGRPASSAAFPGREVAFVSASVLQCRSAPVVRSDVVRKLARGAEVQVLARDGSWISIAHKGRQCWAAARFLSAAEPW